MSRGGQVNVNGPGLYRVQEKASLSSYSLTSSLQLVRIGPLQRSSAVCSTLLMLMALRNHRTAESGVGSSDSLVDWTQARAPWLTSGLGLLLWGLACYGRNVGRGRTLNPNKSVDSWP